MTNEVNARKNWLSFNSTLGEANEHISLRDMASKGVQNKPVSTTLATKLGEMCPCLYPSVTKWPNESAKYLSLSPQAAPVQGMGFQ